MDKSSNTTPNANKKRSLGLSRRIGVNDSKTIAINPIEATPDSSVTSFQCKDETTATKPNKPIGRVSDSAISRITGNAPIAKPNAARHKLSLCKETNAKMTHKRVLSQHAKSSKETKRLKLEPNSDRINKCDAEPKSAAKVDNCDTKPLSDEQSGKLNRESSSGALLQEKVDRIRKQIAMTERYQHETSELQALIIKWRAAGLKTIEEFQDKLEPTQNVSQILAHFHIDPGLFQLDLEE